MKTPYVLTLCAVGAIGVVLSSSSPKPVISKACHLSPGNQGFTRILVIGESWAQRGRLLPDLPNAVSLRTGNTVVACSLGFPGMNTKEQSALLETNFTKDSLERMVGGNINDVVILTGINDVVQHRSAQTYHDDLESLIIAGSKIGASVHFLELPSIDTEPPASGVMQWAKRRSFRYLFDREGGDYITRYRKAALRLSAKRIDYDAFSSGPFKQPNQYRADRIHLTEPEFHRLGAYIGSSL